MAQTEIPLREKEEIFHRGKQYFGDGTVEKNLDSFKVEKVSFGDTKREIQRYHLRLQSCSYFVRYQQQ